MCNVRWVIYLLGVMLAVLPFSLQAEVVSAAVEAVFEITVNTSGYQESAPWNVTKSRRVGTGFIIQTSKGKRILTSAGLVQDAVYITISPNSSAQSFEVKVENISHEVDLATLEPLDEEVFKDRQALDFGEMPKPAQTVSLYGYPVGGESLSVTEGIVSRIASHTYPHSDLDFEAIQIDAATNHGNRGSPALVAGKVVGMAFDFAESMENVSYLIPVPRIQQLLDDLEDGTLDGVPELWLDYQFILNPAQKKSLKLTPQQTGILINKLCSHTDAAVMLDKGDVITAIDGKPLTEEREGQTKGRQLNSFREHIDLQQIDDIVVLDILSNGFNSKRNLRLNSRSHMTKMPESTPRYFIFGGFVFLANRKAPACEPVGENETGVPDDKDYDEVRLVQVLPSSSGNIGFHSAAPMTISTINGESFDTFEDFYSKLKQGSEKNIVLEDEKGYQVVINRHLAESEQDSLLEQYDITKPQSADVDEWDTGD